VPAHAAAEANEVPEAGATHQQHLQFDVHYVAVCPAAALHCRVH
jgi:hypothetical protein